MQAGVYELQQDSRVYEAIQKAGGFAENADISEINQAALLQDEEQIYVPAAGEVDHSLKEEGEAGDAGGEVNLNTATKEELMTLAGIGESKADSIIKYREEHGKFQSIEDIKQIEGIKEETFYCVLFSRYVENKTFEKIAIDMQYSFRQITRLHGKALLAFDKMYGEEYKNMS